MPVHFELQAPEGLIAHGAPCVERHHLYDVCVGAERLPVEVVCSTRANPQGVDLMGNALVQSANPVALVGGQRLIAHRPERVLRRHIDWLPWAEQRGWHQQQALARWCRREALA